MVDVISPRRALSFFWHTHNLSYFLAQYPLESYPICITVQIARDYPAFFIPCPFKVLQATKWLYVSYVKLCQTFSYFFFIFLFVCLNRIFLLFLVLSFHSSILPCNKICISILSLILSNVFLFFNNLSTWDYF